MRPLIIPCVTVALALTGCATKPTAPVASQEPASLTVAIAEECPCSLGSEGVAVEVQEVEPPLLTTQDFESGRLTMSAADSEALERFLRDLNQRKDYDYASHEGKPGPDAAYLASWATRTVDEMVGRGYYFDPSGTLRQPGEVVPVR